MLFILLYSSVSGQDITVHIRDRSLDGNILKTFHCKDTLIVSKQLSEYLSSQYRDGYFSAKYLGINFTKTSVDAILEKGKTFSEINIKVADNLEKHYPYLKFLHAADKWKRLTSSLYSAFEDKVLNYFENNGYPFARVYFDNIKYDTTHFSAFLSVKENNYIQFDSVVTVPNKNIVNQSFLAAYLRIKKGESYSEQLVKQIPQKINALAFMSIIKEPILDFTEKDVRISIPVKPVKTNIFSGIIGFNTTSENKLQLTGNVNLKMENLFKHAENIDLYWRAPGNLSQDLKTKIELPYLFNNPVGVSYNLNLLKRDTSYFNLNQQIGLNYYFSGLNYIQFYYSNFSSSVLTDDSLVNAAYNRYNKSYWGAELKYRKLDYLFNPRKGYYLQASFATGVENKNNRTEIKTTLSPGIYIPLSEKSTIKLGNGSGYMQGTLHQNELYFVGGFSTFRGFDEDYFSVSLYSIQTLEYRFLFEKNSYLAVFADYGYLENSLQNIIYRNYFSAGIGTQLELGGGLLTLYFALPKTENEPVNFKSGKIHFGYTAKF